LSSSQAASFSCRSGSIERTETTIDIDDSADAVPRLSVPLHTFAPGWGYVAGLA
jgi:hypothetical protein